MFATDGHHDNGDDRSGVREDAAHRGSSEHREYSPPQAFSIGSAVRLVRGGFYGKSSDGYTGYYTEH